MLININQTHFEKEFTQKLDVMHLGLMKYNGLHDIKCFQTLLRELN